MNIYEWCMIDIRILYDFYTLYIWTYINHIECRCHVLKHNIASNFYPSPPWPLSHEHTTQQILACSSATIKNMHMIRQEKLVSGNRPDRSLDWVKGKVDTPTHALYYAHIFMLLWKTLKDNNIFRHFNIPHIKQRFSHVLSYCTKHN